VHIFGLPISILLFLGRSYTSPEASIPAYARMLSALGFARAVILLELLTEWGPDSRLRRQVLVENPARLYDFPQGD